MERRPIDIDALLRLAVDSSASDLHLCVPGPPIIRVRGELHALSEEIDLTPQDIEAALEMVVSEKAKQDFYARKELDLTYTLRGVARFRVNAYFQRGTVALAFRALPFHIPTLEELGLPLICQELVMKPRGLVLVTGPSGSGKSSTLAAMVGYLNENCRKRVVTIEEPIEYLYPNKRCTIVQREVGRDTADFAEALRHVLRQDPDVVVIGEIRDLESMSITLTASETGHLVLGTLHTPGAVETIDRIIDFFPPLQQGQVRGQLSLVLEGVISQQLLPRLDGKGRILAAEVMICTDAVRNLIRQGKSYEIPSYIQSGREKGMQSLDWALSDLVKKKLVTREEATTKAQKPEALRALLEHYL